ncbi:MAG: hypothetical protein AABX71_02130, partial [Nanoarchaeota archaeon]
MRLMGVVKAAKSGFEYVTFRDIHRDLRAQRDFERENPDITQKYKTSIFRYATPILLRAVSLGFGLVSVSALHESYQYMTSGE